MLLKEGSTYGTSRWFGGNVTVNALFRGKGWSFGFRTAIMLYFVCLIVLPILGIYTQSFSLGWAPFWESVSDPLAWKAVLLTVKLALIATILNIFLGTMIGWVLIRYRFPGRSLLNSLVDLPFALPTAVGGLLILLLLGPNSLVGSLAESIGIEIVFHEPAIVVAMLFVTFPFVIRAIQPLLEELDKSEEEAAYTLGASKAKTFFQVIFPTMLPGILSGAMLAFSRGLAEFGAVVLVAGNIPGKTLVASVYIFGEIESDNPQGAAAVSVILLTLSFLILWIVNLLQARRSGAK
ncbi:sulfate ABC transporter permease subunit CysT [Paenibacillus nanensis]|uniref:Molybdenum transport system permease n=2 Tax=Paenibacillus nanensis TaxID=393251 RepID=A0A3A1V5B8_9BACL|nr:sulfate ABC transporter permease subunit CysT [Paenibacillus nanensis]